MKWILVAAVVGATSASDLLQSWEMKRQARHGRFGVSWPIGCAVACMALSFFSFLELLKIADLSFAVPATAATIVIETALARWILREHVQARRWIGAVLVACGVALLAGS
jgi:drug/metabolite transporter (DMT)-like permease